MDKNRSYLKNYTHRFGSTPRLQALLKKAVNYPITTITAASGYGKTEMVKDFAMDFSGKVVYLSLSGMDNDATLFWENLIRAISWEQPKLAEELEELSFPQTLMEFTSFYKLIAREIYSGAQILFVLDNYCWIESQEVLLFLTKLFSIELENFSVFIIGHMFPKNIPQNAKVFKITANDLSFNVDEIEQYFKKKNITHKIDCQKIHNQTSGWPFAIDIISSHSQEDLALSNDWQSPIVQRFFTLKFFASYSENIQSLLIRLSLLPQFSFQLIEKFDLGYNMNEVKQAFAKNSLINYHEAYDAFSFQMIYKDFLAAKQNSLTKDEKDSILKISGEYFSQIGRDRHAAECYKKCGMYVELAKSIQYAFRKINEKDINKKYENAHYYLDMFKSIPKDILENNAFLQLVFACVLISVGEYDMSYDLCKSIEKKLINKVEKNREILGEMYLVLSETYAGKCEFGILDCQIKASKLLENGSALRSRTFNAVGNNSVIFLPLSIDEKTGELVTDARPGMLEKVIKEITLAQPLMEKNMHGFTGGIAFLLTCEAAYNTGDFVRAEQMAYKAIYDSKKAEQYDIFCNAHHVLAKVYFAKGDVNEAKFHVNEIEHLIENKHLNNLFDLRDCVNSWFATTLGHPENIVSWLKDGRFDDRQVFPWNTGQEMPLHAYYLLHNKQYSKLFAFLDYFEEVVKKYRKWLPMLIVKIIRAICYYKTNELQLAVEEFKKAYDMSYHNNIIMPYVELGSHIRSLLQYLRTTRPAEMDEQWIESLHKKTSTHAKRLSSIANTYESAYLKQQGSNPLSKRETDILKSLSQGLNREEIGLTYNISVGTVKKYITNIYSKLGAINRADAIYIATQKNIL